MTRSQHSLGSPAADAVALAGDTTPDGSPSAYDRAIAYATAEGARAGAHVAIDYVSGAMLDTVNPSLRQRATAKKILRGIEDGDPAVLDTFPHADLSGEWADTLTGPQLVEDAIRSVTGDDRETETLYAAFSDICDAYETAFDTAVEDAIASAARAILS